MIIINIFYSRKDLKRGNINSQDWEKLSYEDKKEYKLNWLEDIIAFVVEKSKANGICPEHPHLIVNFGLSKNPLGIIVKAYNPPPDLFEPMVDYLTNRTAFRSQCLIERPPASHDLFFSFDSLSDYFYSSFSKAFGDDKSHVFAGSFVYWELKKQIKSALKQQEKLEKQEVKQNDC